MSLRFPPHRLRQNTHHEASGGQVDSRRMTGHRQAADGFTAPAPPDEHTSGRFSTHTDRNPLQFQERENSTNTLYYNRINYKNTYNVRPSFRPSLPPAEKKRFSKLKELNLAKRQNRRQDAPAKKWRKHDVCHRKKTNFLQRDGTHREMGGRVEKTSPATVTFGCFAPKKGQT